MDKDDLVCVCVCVCARARAHKIQHYQAIKKNEILPLTTREDLEISQTEKNKILQVSRICEI